MSHGWKVLEREGCHLVDWDAVIVVLEGAWVVVQRKLQKVDTAETSCYNSFW